MGPAAEIPDIRLAAIPHMEWIPGDRLGPAEQQRPRKKSNGGENQGSNQVDMGDRIQGDPSEVTRCGITEAFGRPRREPPHER